MSKIFYCCETNMKKLPSSCSKCTIWEGGDCTLPDKRHYSNEIINDIIKKQYLRKRHEDCPLMEVEE